MKQYETCKQEGSYSQWQLDIATMTGSLIHEIKNPLSTLSINTQLILEEWKNETGIRGKRTVRRLNIMKGELKRLEEIFNSFLNFTQKHELKLSNVSVNRLLENVIELESEAAEQRDIRIRSSLDQKVPELPLDEELIRQAFVNLIKNAQEAMLEGGELIVKTYYKNSYVFIEIIDTGCGIIPQKLSKIFDLYYSTKDGGTGLGLAISRRIIQEHGGDIEVKSEIDKGTQIAICLPVKNQLKK